MKKIILTISVLCLPLTALAFSDTESHTYSEAIDYIKDKGIVEGYEDNTYKPDQTINRAEFTKIIIEAKINRNPSSSADDCFDDVEEDQWFASYVCYAKDKSIVEGYDDGTFKPEQNIKIVEAAKILVNTLNLNEGDKDNEWYSPYISGLEEEGVIPSSVKNLEHDITRGEMAAMIYRIQENITDRETTDLETETDQACQSLGENIPSSIDMDRIRAEWLTWTNDARAANGLDPYTINEQLNRSATAWSEYVKTRGYHDHKRPGQTAYYDYYLIENWFKDLGLEFENVNRVTFTENITWGPFNCTKSDCTQEVIDGLNTWGFQMFMAEKDKEYRPHYNSIMNEYFNEIGIGLSVQEGDKYYLTVHYGTKIISDPETICQT